MSFCPSQNLLDLSFYDFFISEKVMKEKYVVILSFFSCNTRAPLQLVDCWDVCQQSSKVFFPNMVTPHPQAKSPIKTLDELQVSEVIPSPHFPSTSDRGLQKSSIKSLACDITETRVTLSKIYNISDKSRLDFYNYISQQIRQQITHLESIHVYRPLLGSRSSGSRCKKWGASWACIHNTLYDTIGKQS